MKIFLTGKKDIGLVFNWKKVNSFLKYTKFFSKMETII